jgi:hypothetical protein
MPVGRDPVSSGSYSGPGGLSTRDPTGFVPGKTTRFPSRRLRTASLLGEMKIALQFVRLLVQPARSCRVVRGVLAAAPGECSRRTARLEGVMPSRSGRRREAPGKMPAARILLQISANWMTTLMSSGFLSSACLKFSGFSRRVIRWLSHLRSARARFSPALYQ